MLGLGGVGGLYKIDGLGGVGRFERVGDYPNHSQRRHYKLDGVGPVDNRPLTDKLHHFVYLFVTCDILHVTHDT